VIKRHEGLYENTERFVSFRVEVCPNMKAFLRRETCLCVVLVVLLLLGVRTGLTIDNLYVTGVVRSVDPGSGTVRVDVTSEGCKGLREFQLSKDAVRELDNSLIGKRTQFHIDTNMCERGKIYTILERKP